MRLLSRSLEVICPSCDYLNVVGAVRCMACGMPTDGTAAPAPRAPTPQPMPVALADAPPELTPPGLKRAGVPHVPAPQPPVETTPSAVVARPTFTSSSPSQQQAPGPRYGLTVMAGPSRGQRFKLGANGAQVGRSRGAILFPDDPFVSPLHASLLVRDQRLYVRDEDSTSGVYVSITGTETIPPGATFCTGLRLFRYAGAVEPSPPWNRHDVVIYGAPLPNNQVHYAFEELLLGARPGRCLITPGPVLTIGQGRCDFSYPNDEGLAPRHCELAPMPTGVMIRDLSGGLGTFVRSAQERALKPGDRIRIGQQTLQVEQLQ